MNTDDYNAYCASLPHSTHVVQWGHSHVWKIGGKVYAIGGGSNERARINVTFKCSDLSFDILKEQPGCRPAPYLASRGMKWIQRVSDASLSDDDLKAYIAESRRLVGTGLTKKKQREFGLLDTESAPK